MQVPCNTHSSWGGAQLPIVHAFPTCRAPFLPAARPQRPASHGHSVLPCLLCQRGASGFSRFGLWRHGRCEAAIAAADDTMLAATMTGALRVRSALTKKWLASNVIVVSAAPHCSSLLKRAASSSLRMQWGKPADMRIACRRRGGAGAAAAAAGEAGEPEHSGGNPAEGGGRGRGAGRARHSR